MRVLSSILWIFAFFGECNWMPTSLKQKLHCIEESPTQYTNTCRPKTHWMEEEKNTQRMRCRRFSTFVLISRTQTQIHTPYTRTKWYHSLFTRMFTELRRFNIYFTFVFGFAFARSYTGVSAIDFFLLLFVCFLNF